MWDENCVRAALRIQSATQLTAETWGKRHNQWRKVWFEDKVTACTPRVRATAKLVDACLSHLVTTYQHDQNPARYGSPNDPPTPLPEYGTAAFLQRLHAELSDVEDDDEDLQRSFTAPDPHRPAVIMLRPAQ